MFRCEPRPTAVRHFPSRAHVQSVRKCNRLHFQTNLSTAAVLVKPRHEPHTRPPNLEKTYTLLHRTEDLLTQVLHPTSSLLNFWSSVVQSARRRVTAPVELSSRRRVAVYGLENSSTSREFVTALLEDPLSSNEEQRNGLRERWNDTTRDEPFTFEYDGRYSQNGRLFRCASPWLDRLSITLTELPPGSSKNFSELFDADFPIVIIDPLVTPLPKLRDVLPPSSDTILVVNCTVGRRTAQHIEAVVQRSLDGQAVRVLFIDIERALESVDALRNGPTSHTTVQKYQDNYLASQMPSILTALEQSFKSKREIFQLRTTYSIARQALTICHDTLQSNFQDIDALHLLISRLRSRVLDEKERVTNEVLGPSDGPVEAAVKKAGKDIKFMMDNMSWWQLLFSVDELSQVVSRAIERSSLRDLETKLILQTGRLVSVQDEFMHLTNAQVASLPPAFNSSVLRNTLAQLSSTPEYPLSSTSLTGPLHTRLEQLTFPTNNLHLTAQRNILGTAVTTFASAAAAYGAWLTVLVDEATALGLGALGAAVTLRWAVGKWEKAKTSWWQDWLRVSEGLKRDLTYTLSETLDQKVFIVPETACAQLVESGQKRTRELDNLQDLLEKLEVDIKPLDV